MTFHIVAHRKITSPELLSALELAQLEEAGRRYDGEVRAPELRFVEVPTEDGEPDEGCFGAYGFLSVSKVFDGSVHAFDLWTLDPDSASLFDAGTTVVVAGRCQSTWMTPDLMEPFEHAAALDAAMTAAGIW